MVTLLSALSRVECLDSLIMSSLTNCEDEADNAHRPSSVAARATSFLLPKPMSPTSVPQHRGDTIILSIRRCGRNWKKQKQNNDKAKGFVVNTTPRRATQWCWVSKTGLAREKVSRTKRVDCVFEPRILDWMG